MNVADYSVFKYQLTAYQYMYGGTDIPAHLNTNIVTFAGNA